MTPPERLFGIIGRPLGHSFSATYFNDKFRDEHIHAEYRKFELPDIGDLMELLSEYTQLEGLNVTIPYKQLAIPYMDEMDPEASAIGAINVIRISWDENDEPVMKGFNTDVIGFRDSIRPLLNDDRRKALVLGTGGASKAVVYGLRSLGVEPTLVSRTPGEGMLGYADLTPEVMEEHNVIVNATPVGTYPDVDECPPIPYDLLTPAHLCYDLVYNPDPTLFLRRAAEHGATVKSGLEMLYIQAREAWRIWNE
ncbi:MAG: shikimate dehydrogenase [Duncaniella sp.]|nr:shikimate dehydrogenase [Duncaniella sp.]